MRRQGNRAFWPALALLLGALTWRPASADTREKTDVITLRNGDRFTGRIISVQHHVHLVRVRARDPLRAAMGLLDRVALTLHAR